MGLLISFTNTDDTQRDSHIREAIERTIANVEGDWKVSIFGAPDSTTWNLKIDGPGGFKFSRILTGDETAQYIAEVVRDAVCSADASLGLLRAQGFSVSGGEFLIGSSVMTFRVQKGGGREFILTKAVIEELRRSGKLSLEGIERLDRLSQEDK
jgi:hypothetical protein